jgi:MFS family permease
LAANFLLFFAFYLILPVLPFYLTEVFRVDNAAVGIILASYTIACLCIRPFSGYVLDTFARKPIYLVAYFIFASIFVGYMLAGVLTAFVFFRVLHGLAFGMVTVAGNTIVIDITPSERRGEAIGYYGLVNNIALSFGPMVGLFLHSFYSFETVFLCSIVSGAAGFVIATLVKTPKKQPVVQQQPFSLDRFFLKKGTRAGMALFLLSIPYGITTTYIAMYAEAIHIAVTTGLFFTVLAIGLGISRIFSGKQVDRGRVTQTIKFGLILVSVSFFMLSSCGWLMQRMPDVGTFLFFFVPLLLGIGFGTIFPAYNSLFVNLAEHNQRATATSTYLTSWDVGIGIGLVTGGTIAQYTSFATTFFVGAILTVVSMIYFWHTVSPHFERNKLR